MAFYVGQLLITTKYTGQDLTSRGLREQFQVTIFRRYPGVSKKPKKLWSEEVSIPWKQRMRDSRYEAARSALSFATNDNPEIEDLIEGWYDRKGNVILEPGRLGAKIK